MSKKLMAAMTTSISEVMETMFFIPVDSDENQNTDQADLEGQPYCCRLTYKGEIDGAVIICAPKRLLSEMTSNFIGEDQEQMTEELLNGTLKEMLNMVCGNALRKFDASMPFELGIPEVIAPPNLSDISELKVVKTANAAMTILLDTGAK